MSLKLHIALKISSVVFALFVGVGVGIVAADRPTAPQLFPDSALGYVRINDVQELKAKWSETSFGRLVADPQISPFFADIYGYILTEAESIQERTGLSLEELLQIPQGELAFTIIPGEEEPAVLILIQADEHMNELQLLLDGTVKKRMLEQKGETIAGLELHYLENEDGRGESFNYFNDQGVLVFSSDKKTVRNAALVWTGNGIDHHALSDKREFTEILSRCTGTQGERPQISFFVDPLAIFKFIASKSDDFALTAANSMLPVLGLDGIKGIGGSAIFATEDFDSIIHAHLLLGSPRRAFLSVVRPKEGSIEPETWVAEDVAAYMTINWRTQDTIKAIENVFDSFAGDKAFDLQMQEASDQIGFNLRKEFYEQIGDRFSMAQVVLKPATLNAASNVYAIELLNAEQFKTVTFPKVEKFLMNQDKQWEKVFIGDLQVLHNNAASRFDAVRAQDFTMAIFNDRLIIADSLKAMDQVLQTYQSSSGLLIDSLEFKLIKQRIAAQVQDTKVCGMSMSRPEETIRTFYDMAADPKMRNQLKENSENNRFFQALYASLEKNQLPPFEVVRKHLAPTGAFISEDDSGVHYTAFGLRR